MLENMDLEKHMTEMSDRKLGEIKRGIDVGLNSLHKHMYLACEKCGKERWVKLRHGKPESKKCKLCGRERHRFSKEEQEQNILEGHPFWFSRRLTNYGYSIIQLSPKDKLYCMADKNGCIKEHRYLVAEQNGRPLLKNEHVHHKNGIKTDNRLGNLELISQANHVLYRQICSHCELRTEIRLLRWQIKQLTQQLQGKFNLSNNGVIDE